MISICIPVYNYDVSNLLNQLLQQCNHLPEFTEILLYDDASIQPLNLKSIQNLVTIYRGNENIGSVASRKYLASKTTNDWILFLDTDLKLPSSIFLSSYLNSIDKSNTVYYGGVSYNTSPPEADKVLRWKYGHQREMRKPQTQDEVYTHFVSCSFLIQKNTFNSIFTKASMPGYGQDIYLSLIHI